VEESRLWEAVFGNRRPVEIEIGPGRGEVLLAFAAARPDTNFFGIQWGACQAELLRERLASSGLGNARVVGGDARCIVSHLVPPRSVEAYHVYFPDPWPKTRHRHRRLFQPHFVEALRRTLVRGGHLHVATDLPELFRDITRSLEAGHMRRVTPSDPRPPRPVTRFERKYATNGVFSGAFAEK